MEWSEDAPGSVTLNDVGSIKPHAPAPSGDEITCWRIPLRNPSLNLKLKRPLVVQLAMLGTCPQDPGPEFEVLTSGGFAKDFATSKLGVPFIW